MEMFLPVLFISLLVAFVVVFFAFFPIKVTWFFEKKKPEQMPKRVIAKELQFAPERFVSRRPFVDDDDYDDKEL
jgi:hypothetical protein